MLITSCSQEDVKLKQYYIDGQALYKLHCANCHQDNGQGLAGLYPPIAGSDFLKDNKNLILCSMRNGLKDTIVVNGKTYRAFIKDLQFHPVSDALLHVDFVELVEGKEVKVELPLRLTGNSVGVRAGGKLMQKVRKVLVKTPVSALVDHLSLDISNMDLGKSLRMRDIVLPEGVSLLGAPATPVATIEIPRALRSAQAAEAKSAAGAKKKK